MSPQSGCCSIIATFRGRDRAGGILYKHDGSGKNGVEGENEDRRVSIADMESKVLPKLK